MGNVMMTALTETPTISQLGERELRKLIDSSVGRALFDKQYEKQLLADPSLVLGDSGCTPQQHLELRGIRAEDLQDFAAQALALFWPTQRPRRAEAEALAAGL